MYRKKHLYLVEMDAFFSQSWGLSPLLRVAIIAENSKQARLRSYGLFYMPREIRKAILLHKKVNHNDHPILPITIHSIVRARNQVFIKSKLFPAHKAARPHFLAILSPGSAQRRSTFSAAYGNARRRGSRYYVRRRYIAKDKPT